MFEKESLVGFFSSNVKVYASLAVLVLLSWMFAFKPTLSVQKDLKKVEREIVLAMQVEKDTRLYSESYPFVTSKDSLSHRDRNLLNLLNSLRSTFGYEIMSVQPYTFNAKSGVTSISTLITLKGNYFSFVRLVDRINQSPEMGKIISLKIYVHEDRITKGKTLYCDLILQIITEI